MSRPRANPATLLALGVALAWRGILAKASAVIAALTVIGMAVVGFALLGKGASPPMHDVPVVASSALAWGGGFMLAFGAAVHALRRDVDDGVRGMLELRAVDERGYLFARVGGLAVLVAIVVAGGTLLVGLVSILLGASVGAAGRTLATTLASVVFAVAFAAVIAPTALAALGARTRVGGYLFLASVVVLPELVAFAAGDALPSAVADVLSIPSALGALRAALLPGSVDVARFARALLALALFVALTMVLVRREASTTRHEERA